MNTDVILAKWIRAGDRVLDVGNSHRHTRFARVTAVATHSIEIAEKDDEFEPFTAIVIYVEGGGAAVFLPDDQIEIETPVEESA